MNFITEQHEPCDQVKLILYGNIHAPYQVTCKRIQETNDTLKLVPVETYKEVMTYNTQGKKLVISSFVYSKSCL